jgi:hypothetical protein
MLNVDPNIFNKRSCITISISTNSLQIPKSDAKILRYLIPEAVAQKQFRCANLPRRL